MKRSMIAPACFAVSVGLLPGAPAAAQHIVYDPTAYAQMLREAQTALSQLNALRTQVEQGQALLSSLNDISDVNAIASQLGLPAVRNPLPDMAALGSVTDGDLSGLGSIADRAAEIRETHRLYSAPEGELSEAEAWYRDSLERSGAVSARDYAVSEAVAEAADARLEGLETLRQALDTAPSARAVLDLNARLVAEQALIENEQIRLQGLALMREAEASLADQQQRERAETAHQARLRLYEAAFQ